MRFHVSYSHVLYVRQYISLLEQVLYKIFGPPANDFYLIVF